MTASSDFRKYDNQSSTFEITFSTSDSTLKVLICISELIVEFTTKSDSSSSDFISKQSIFVNDQSDDADLSDHFINMSKQLLKKHQCIQSQQIFNSSILYKKNELEFNQINKLLMSL